MAAPQKLQPIRPNNSPFSGSDPQLGEEVMKMKADLDAHFLHSFSSHLPFSSSSSSECSDENEEDPTPTTKKRKKTKKMESFLEDLMGQVMRKQEQMHQQLMELIDKKDKERILREEAWRRLELERAQREHQIRSQEASRNISLISFIRNALGQDVQIPTGLEDVKHNNDGDHDDKVDLGCKRWPTSEVQALITVRAALDHRFLAHAPKAHVWEEVSAAMSTMGFSRTSKKCKEKWENINKYYKKASATGRENAKSSCPYFHELDTLYSNRLITDGKPAASVSPDIAAHKGNF